MSHSSAPSTDILTIRRLWRCALGWIVAGFVGRLLLALAVPLLPDETYYWDWTRRLAPGYFDHPPGVALLIRGGVVLLGNTPAGVRVGPAIAALATHLAAVALAWSLGGRRRVGAESAARAAALVALLPIAGIGLVPATPDAVLFVSAMLALVCVERALASSIGSRQSTTWWVLTGVMTGAALVAKYTAVLLPGGLLVACLAHPSLRARLREPGPWFALVVAALLFSPVIVWNAAHDWISFRFQLGHGFSAITRGTAVSRELELIGGQLALASPVLAVLLGAAVWESAKDGWRLRLELGVVDPRVRRFALAVIAMVTMTFFSVSAWRRTVEPNWPALIYPSAIALLASTRASWARGRAWRGGLALAAVLIVSATLQAWRPLLPLPPRRDPFGRAHGWDTLAKAVEDARTAAFLVGTTQQLVAADRYQEASELAFHLPGQPVVFSLNLGGRANQYDLWPTMRQKASLGDGLVAVFDATTFGDSLAANVGTWFVSTQQGETVRLRRGDGVIAERRIWSFRTRRSGVARVDSTSTLSAER